MPSLTLKKKKKFIRINFTSFCYLVKLDPLGLEGLNNDRKAFKNVTINQAEILVEFNLREEYEEFSRKFNIFVAQECQKLTCKHKVRLYFL